MMREHRGEESEKGSAVRAATEEAERNRCRSEGADCCRWEKQQQQQLLCRREGCISVLVPRGRKWRRPRSETRGHKAAGASREGDCHSCTFH